MSDTEEVKQTAEPDINRLRREKAKLKSALTKSRNKLTWLIDQDDSNKEEIQQQSDIVTSAYEAASEVLQQMYDEQERRQDAAAVQKLLDEIEIIEEDYRASVQEVQRYLKASAAAVRPQLLRPAAAATHDRQFDFRGMREDFTQGNKPQASRQGTQDHGEFSLLPPSLKQSAGLGAGAEEMDSCYGDAGRSRVDSSTEQELSKDLWKMLRRVEIPTFYGEKQQYEAWKAAFMACIDKAPATPEFKLLQLRQYLRGDALKVVEHLGHSAAAYEAAKERLEREYGGRRRQLALYLEELDSFPLIRHGSASELKKFSNLLDVAVINLEEAGKDSELSDGLLYARLQKKLPEQMVASFRRWIFEKEKNEGVKTLREWVLREAEFQTQASEIVHGVSSSGAEKPKKDVKPKVFHASQQVKSIRKEVSNCIVCKEAHELWKCSAFAELSMDKRWKAAQEAKACFRCLGFGHTGQNCRRGRKCGVDGCNKSHHRLLHSSRGSEANVAPSVTEAEKESPKQKTEARTMVSKEASAVSLRTIPVILKANGRKVRVNALLDDASTRTYLNSEIAASLGLQGKQEKVQVNVLNGQTETFMTAPVTCTLESSDGRLSTSITAFTADRVTGSMKVVDWQHLASKWPHLADIPFPRTQSPPVVDLLLGVDHADLHASQLEVHGKPGEPQARLTPLGWTCIGNVDCTPERTMFASTFFSRGGTESLSPLLRRFWEVEEVERVAPPSTTKEEQLALELAKSSMSFSNGRYQIGVPWKPEAEIKSNNREMAVNRLRNTEKRLLKDLEIANRYQEVIDRYEKVGYIRKVQPEESEPANRYFLPHFPVVRMDRATTKVRIVFDASAGGDQSLNHHMLPGPKLQQDLVDVLLRFRKHPIAVACDVSEMYLQIEITPQDRPAHSFLWRGMDQSSEPKTFEFNRVVFGATSSPFLAQFVTQEHARKLEEDLPLAADTVLHATYMDDCLDSKQSEAEAVQLYEELKQLWERAGMHARKWMSNSRTLLARVPPEDRATEISLDGKSLPDAKTLGVVWKSEDDKFTFTAETASRPAKTKRELLKKVASVYDPLGLIAPFTVQAKVLLQELWCSGSDWDEVPDEVLQRKLEAWCGDLANFNHVQVHRCLQPPGEVIQSVLHCFVDASEKAYGAVCYWRCEFANAPTAVRLIAAKSRVAPIATVSIPRLELMAAVLGLHLATKITKALEINMSEVIFWSDSMNVLFWIRGRGRYFKPFVANRIGEIQQSSEPSQWRHVPTSSNPADLLSRGATINQLCEDSMWQQGPDFLQQEEKMWPNVKLEKPGHMEMKKQFTEGSEPLTFASSIEKEREKLLDPHRFSSWMRLVRLNAWVARFANNCRLSQQHRVKGELQPSELEDAEANIIREAQQQVYSEEMAVLSKGKSLPMNNRLASLCPMLDSEGMLRSDSRLKLATSLPFNARFPIILPRHHRVTELIIKQHHESAYHAGTNQVLATLSARFWIPAAREAIREWEGKCAMCRRQKAQPASQRMAPLPTSRLEPLRAFTRVSVDFGGPFLTKQGRGRVRQKRYLALFTCMATRAVHLEMAYGLDTSSFLNALFRMISRRGQVLKLYSDNGTNFIGADRELKDLWAAIDRDELQRRTSHVPIKWHFNPPATPHFGGVHESMIKSAKRAISAILKSAEVSDEELATAFAGAESLLNSRPLTYQSAHPGDDLPLTPGHFLYGHVGGQMAPEIADEDAFTPTKRWRHVQQLIGAIWQRWMQEWLPSLGGRSKWRRVQPNLKPGDVVIHVSPDNTRGHWPLGRVLEVYPGADGLVRVAKVQVADKALVRPVNKLCPLVSE